MSDSLEVSITAKTLGAFRSGTISGRAEMGRQLDTFIGSHLTAAKNVLAAATPRGPEPYNDPNHVHMQDVWYVTNRGPRSGSITNAAPWASYQFTGTKPHTIQARYAATLAFMGRGGNLVFPFVVHHPGTKPNVTLVNTMDTEVRFLRDDFAKMGMRLAATFARSVRSSGDVV
jgi:hypothetical protein